MTIEELSSAVEEIAPGQSARRTGLRGRLLLASVAVLLFAGVLTLGIAMAKGVGSRPSGEVDPDMRVAADFTLPTFDGQQFTLSEHATGPVFLYFWASWCIPCQKEAPTIQALSLEYQARGYTFVGVNITDAESDARDFIKRYGLTFPLVRDVNGSVYLEYGVVGVPEAFFLRPGLQVQKKFFGPLSEQQLRGMLDELQ